MKKMLIAFSLFLFFSGCSVNQITMNQIQTIEKGITKEEFSLMLGSKKPISEFSIQYKERNFFVQIFNMVVHKEEYHFYGKNSFGTGGGNVSLQFSGFTPPAPPTMNMPHHHSYSQTYTEPFSFLFLEGKLYYWGLFEELYKSEDSTVVEIAPKIEIRYRQLEIEKQNSSNW